MKDNTQTATSIYDQDFELPLLDGKPKRLSDFKGKKLLIVNTASECGFTPQYADLQKLQEEYVDKINVIGFPSNDFGSQEPGSNTEIGAFCQRNFGVTFPVFEKIKVSGAGKAPVYQWLSDKSKNGWNEQEPTWNFCKYLLNEKGELMNFFSATVNPLEEEITGTLK